MKILILVCLSALVAGCSVFSPTPTCPTDDAYDYFSCAKPTSYGSEDEPDVFQNLVDVVDTHCEDDAGEWIPVLEERVRAFLPEVSKFLASGQKLKEWLPEVFTLEGQAIESLNDNELYRSVLAIYLFTPVNAGVRNKVYLGRKPGSFLNPSDCKPLRTESCVRVFEFINSENLIEFMIE